MTEPFNPLFPASLAGQLECEKFCRELTPALRMFYELCGNTLQSALKRAESPAERWREFRLQVDRREFRAGMTRIFEELDSEAAKGQTPSGTHALRAHAVSDDRLPGKDQATREPHGLHVPPEGGANTAAASDQAPVETQQKTVADAAATNTPVSSAVGDHGYAELQMISVPSAEGNQTPSEGHGPTETQFEDAADGERGGGDHGDAETHSTLVSPPREPSALQRRAITAARRLTLPKIFDKPIPTGVGNHKMRLGDLPTSAAALKKLEARLGKRAFADTTYYNIVRRWREYVERQARIPAAAKLQDVLNRKAAENLAASGVLTTIETMFLVPKELAEAV